MVQKIDCKERNVFIVGLAIIYRLTTSILD